MLEFECPTRGGEKVPMKYSPERREAILAKLEAPYNRTVSELATEEGISAATLYNWRKQARRTGRLLPNASTSTEGWSSRHKFNAVLETAALTEEELAEYCRRRGLYPEQIRRWRASCEQANERADLAAERQSESTKAERKRIRELERELRRKEAALAETAYYKPTKAAPKVKPELAEPIKAMIEESPSFGYRTVAYLLGMNKNTVQRIFQLKGWQVKKRAIGFRPRIQALPSVASAPNERWSTDLCRIWAGRDGWATLALVINCHTRELLGWHLSRSGKATTAGSALEHALIARFGTLGRVAEPFLLRSDNGK
ncbi:hypothetical protein CJO09_06415 [Neopusillimonas maritima]|uniref:Integrase catalytic domain-containing protein n=2 Tax=Neopusillimonas maritima TaxID=2026239 RepID=A0ABX9MW84_9BURK|nr:hypothetical protein CJO09_06415 [Neopusillimonas maritima]